MRRQKTRDDYWFKINISWKLFSFIMRTKKNNWEIGCVKYLIYVWWWGQKVKQRSALIDREHSWNDSRVVHVGIRSLSLPLKKRTKKAKTAEYSGPLLGRTNVYTINLCCLQSYPDNIRITETKRENSITFKSCCSYHTWYLLEVKFKDIPWLSRTFSRKSKTFSIKGELNAKTTLFLFESIGIVD